MQAPPPPFSTWKAFYDSAYDGFDEGSGIRYDGTLYSWQTLRKLVTIEAGLPEPFDESVTSLSFSCNEGELVIKYEQDWNSGKMWLRITGYPTVTSRGYSEIWVMEAYESSLATNRRFRTFDQEQADYMMRRLIQLHSIT
jgi:hypothetical protein